MLRGARACSRAIRLTTHLCQASAAIAGSTIRPSIIIPKAKAGASSSVSNSCSLTFTSRFDCFRFYSSGAGNTSRVIVIKGESEYFSALGLAQDNQGLGVVYFTAKWCGPCKMIAPIVDELSTKYDKATFLKVDIDEEDLARVVTDENIASVPTFRFFKGGKSVADVIGANPTELKDKLATLSK